MYSFLSEPRRFILLLFLNSSLVVSAHIPAVHRLHTHPNLKLKRPTVAMGTVSTLSALLPQSEVICPLPIFHSLSKCPPPPFTSLKDGKEKIPPSILKRHDYSFSYSLSQIHSPTVFGTSNLLSSHSHSHSIQPL